MSQKEARKAIREARFYAYDEMYSKLGVYQVALRMKIKRVLVTKEKRVSEERWKS